MTTHTVTKGDTLWTIAKKLLGDGNRYREIMTVNSMLDTVIRPGQVLKIPSKGSGSTYEEIGRAFEKALNDVDKLPSVQKLYQMIGD